MQAASDATLLLLLLLPLGSARCASSACSQPVAQFLNACCVAEPSKLAGELPALLAVQVCLGASGTCFGFDNSCCQLIQLRQQLNISCKIQNQPVRTFCPGLKLSRLLLVCL
jgi:hypothetical protein